MADLHEDPLPDELEAVVARLRSEKPNADPLHLDQVKQRLIARVGTERRESFMKSRVATVITALALVGGSGGAIAIGGVGNKGPHGGAAKGEYFPGKGCGDKNHQHRQMHGNIKPCPPQSQH